MALQRFIIVCEIKRNWVSDFIKCIILQDKVKLVRERKKKSAQKLRISRNRNRVNCGDPRKVPVNGTPIKNVNGKLSHCDWPVILSVSALPGQFAHTRCMRLWVNCTVHMQWSINDKLPAIIT